MNVLDEGLLDELVRLFQAASVSAYEELLPVTLGIAAALFALQLTWDLGVWSLKGEAGMFGMAVRKLVVFLILFNLISLVPLWLPAVIEGFSGLGQRLTGVGLSPSAFFGQGLDLGFTLFNSWERILTLLIPTGSQLRLWTFLIVVASFALLALQMARVLIEVTFALGGLTVFLAFWSHKMTFGLAEGYLRYVLELGIKIFLLQLVLAVGQDLGASWDEALRQPFALIDPRPHLTIVAASALLALLGLAVPGQVAARIAGSLSFSGLNPMRD